MIIRDSFAVWHFSVTSVLQRVLWALLLLLLCGVGSALSAMQAQPRVFISPIVHKPFEASIVPFTKETFHKEMGVNAVNMGIDDDGCRHNSGFSEYDYYIVCCPYSLFSAVSSEWDERSKKFTVPLDAGFVDWVLSDAGMGATWKIVQERNIRVMQQIAAAQNKVPMDPKDFVLEQEEISVIDKYKYALRCYAKRGARPAFMAKIALTAAWSIRVHLNRQLTDPDLLGGVSELNTRIGQHVDEDKSFNIQKWLIIYENVRTKKLSDEAYLVASCAQIGLELRLGNHDACRKILDAMRQRFSALPQDHKLRLVLRERQSFINTYRDFIDASVISFVRAIAGEEVRRAQLPVTMIAIAEGFRRSGQIDNAIDWYLAVDHLPETDRERRLALKAAGKKPVDSDSSAFHFAWKAMDKLEQLMSLNPEREARIIGEDSKLLHAIVTKNLGTSRHKNPDWRPTTGAPIEGLEALLDHMGKSLINYEFRLGRWPSTLGQLWDDGAIADWNRLNRFHCPVTGAAFAYAAPKFAREKLFNPRTVLIASRQAVETADGRQFLNYLANDTLYWSASLMQPGDHAPKPQAVGVEQDKHQENPETSTGE